MKILYKVLYAIVWPFFNLLYPTFCIGRENIPDGGALICANHSAYADPLMMLYAVKSSVQPRFMAKAELLRIPLLGSLLKAVGVFGVERGKGDAGAVNTAIHLLKEGDVVLMYPEGTRIKRGRRVRAKSGAIRIALAADKPIVPMFVPQRKRLFRKNVVVVGRAYKPEVCESQGHSEYMLAAEDLLERIYSLALTDKSAEKGLWDISKER